MGSYLSEPITEKISVDEENDKLAYGASSMQGWRESQEDGHNAILNFDEKISYFAVYDGHGGHEVAQYCSQELPNFIKNTDAYKRGDIEQALIDGFLGFDASITKPEIIKILKDIATDRHVEESDEENVNNLYEEASMPIEKVIEKYTNLVNPTLKALKKGEKLPRSPVITPKRDKSLSSLPSGSSVDDEPGGSKDDISSEVKEEVKKDTENHTSSENSISTDIMNGEDKKDIETSKGDVSPNGPVPKIVVEEVKSETPSKVEELEGTVHNGDIEKGDKENKDTPEGTPNKGKGKAILKKGKSPINTRPKRSASQLYKKLLDYQEDSEDESEDEEDKTFVEPAESSDDDDDVNVAIEDGSEGETSEEGEEEEVEEEEEDEELDEESEHTLEFARNMKEEPGSDSGCTAVVAIVHGTELYVANAGDSRCIICRNGNAVEMSFDHKPEDEPEKTRILNAGGEVTVEGRVNGGLNLSRAIGDHAYKQNKDLSDKEQMITALPDIKKLTINPSEDEFMVLACDGIWNFMSSQEVVEFVKPRLDANPEKISSVCEEMFDHCLAPDTMGDGTGCDNMTAIIVKFKPNMKKRVASPDPEKKDSETKRAKTDNAAEEGKSSS